MPHRIHIKADTSSLAIPWGEIWEYRDLLWFLVLRDFTAVYKQSILGPVWFVLQPLATTIVFTVVFGNIAKVSTDGLPPFLFFSAGMVLWNYFQGVMNGVSATLITHANVLGKVYFPRLVLPLAITASNFGTFALNLLVFLGFWGYYRFFTAADIHASVWLAALPLLIVQTALVGLGVGLWLSALTAKYRDLRFAMPFVAQLWMFATPIIFPASSVVSRKWSALLAVNPMAGLVEVSKFMFLGVGRTDPMFLIIGLVSGWLLVGTGMIVFQRVQRTFVDTI